MIECIRSCKRISDGVINSLKMDGSFTRRHKCINRNCGSHYGSRIRGTHER
jgi:hypothetical protein